METLLDILEELRTLNNRGESEADGGTLPIDDEVVFNSMCKELQKPRVRRSMVNTNNDMLYEKIKLNHLHQC